MLNRFIRFFLENKLIAFLLVFGFTVWGIATAPFSWEIDWLPKDPVPVDAIPDLGENQQIVFTKWPGRSPQDVEDQVTYPLTTTLLGVPGVKTIRSSSMFGFSSIYVIFEEDIEFYWSRSRILEKLNALPANTLPNGATPSLGPDATALGQIFWYTLEGRDDSRNVTGGWDLQELRSIQDFTVKYGLSAVPGVAEVASVGGHVKEYQVDIDPLAMKNYGVTLAQVINAVRNSNLDVGAKTIEINRAEYMVRGLGYVKSIEDLELAVVAVRNNVPIRVKEVARVNIGPAPRRGVLDKGGAEVAGGVVVSRFGANPLEVIQNVKKQIATLAPGLPEKTLDDGTRSKVTIVPFYDRSQLIQETLGTLESALTLEVLITIIVILLMVFNFRSSLIISAMLPLAVLMCFIAMRYFKVDANIVALSGIAIAIGTMVDMGIVLLENILRHLRENENEPNKLEVVYRATIEVAGAVVTAVATTIVSFLPVFTMVAAEGKLFRPLAFTKTFALLAAVFIAIAILPAFAQLILPKKTVPKRFRWVGIVLVALGVAYLLAIEWMPLGATSSELLNFIVTVLGIGLLIGFFYFIIHYYRPLLGWCLRFKAVFLIFPLVLLIWGGISWSQMGKEFMPALDEGSFLLMPSSMPHSGMEENTAILQQLDMAVAMIPEVESVVGKLGRVESPLDPAPVSMFENVINYKSEYLTDENGRRLRDENGQYIRQWRDHIHSPDDIWKEIAKIQLPGVTAAPKLQPIETRLVMLQTGMRAPMGIRVKGKDLRSIEAFGMELEERLKQVEGVKTQAVFADRIVGKPYLEIDIKRPAIARYGLSIKQVQQFIETAIGGMSQTYTVEGRERYPVRVRYARELRDHPETIKTMLLQGAGGVSVPLGELVEIRYEQGPQVIKSENTFLVGYVLFDMLDSLAEVEVVEAAQEYIQTEIEMGRLTVPEGISFEFAGSYENQVRAEKRLGIVLPLSLGIIFLILWFQFRSVAATTMIFSGIFVAFAGGFILLSLWGPMGYGEVNLSVAVWVGFIALFGIATDDGVVMATYLKQVFAKQQPKTKEAIRQAVLEAGQRRIRPCLMTTATTILALLPVLSATGRGADIMVPMAIPVFGGMVVEVITLFVVPVLWSWWWELRLKE